MTTCKKYVFTFLIFLSSFCTTYGQQVDVVKEKLVQMVKSSNFFENGNLEIIEINERHFLVSVHFGEIQSAKSDDLISAIHTAEMLSQEQLVKFVYGVKESVKNDYQIITTIMNITDNGELVSIKSDKVTNYLSIIKEISDGILVNAKILDRWKSADKSKYYVCTFYEIKVDI